MDRIPNPQPSRDALSSFIDALGPNQAYIRQGASLLSYDAIIRFAGQQGLGHMAFLQPIDLWCLRGVATAAPNEEANETGAGAESSPQ